ncbi:MAG TPA: M48 family metalloprotease [Xanthobacteraceae bacterium]
MSALFVRKSGRPDLRRAERSLIALLAAALALAACSGDRFLGDQQSVMPTAPPQTAAAPPAPSTPAEREHQRILAAYGGAYDDTKLETRVSTIVNRLVAASDRPDITYKVTLLNSPAVNAFALPTGQLYVTRGLLALANDDAELASVLSHEMSHVIAKHAALREEEARTVSITSSVVNDVLSDPQEGALALARSKIKFATFSRAQEFQADEMGVGIAARAGYDPFGAARFLTSMGRNADLRAGGNGADVRSPDFFSSHPATPERVKAAQTTARQYSAPGTSAEAERDRTAYLASLDGLVYGEDPIEGYVRGRRFLHPKLGFTFTAPEGFTLENTAQAVLGLKDGGNEALKLDAVHVAAEQSLSDYLGSGWIENVDKASIQELNIGGLAAATASAKSDQWAFRLYAIRFNGSVYRFIFASKSATPETERAFRDSVGSFRRLSIAEAQQAKPLRLKIVTVKPGDTVEKLASRMAMIDRQVERFRVLNGLGAGEKLRVGSQVKIVVE